MLVLPFSKEWNLAILLISGWISLSYNNSLKSSVNFICPSPSLVKADWDSSIKLNTPVDTVSIWDLSDIVGKNILAILILNPFTLWFTVPCWISWNIPILVISWSWELRSVIEEKELPFFPYSFKAVSPKWLISNLLAKSGSFNNNSSVKELELKEIPCKSVINFWSPPGKAALLRLSILSVT